MLLLLLRISVAQAAVDLNAVPESFCQPALSVAEVTPSCQANTNFLDHANACMEKLNQLEATLGAEAKAIARPDMKSQKGETGKGRSEYEYSAQALVYLDKVARLAFSELNDYRKYVAAAALDDGNGLIQSESSVGWMNQLDCYGGVKRKLQEIQGRFGEKIAMYDGRHQESVRNQSALRKNGSNYGSLGGAVGGREAAKTKPVPRGTSKNSSSSITGVVEDEQKRAKP